MNRPVRRVTLTIAALCICLAGATSASANDTTSTSGSATAKAAYGSATTISPSAAIGSGLLGPTVAAVIQPIADTLSYAINSQVQTAVRGLLNSSGNTADTTTGPASYPTGPLGKVAIPGLLAVTLYGPQGSVTASSSAYSASSKFTAAELQVLGLALGDLGVASADVTCPTVGTGTPTADLKLGGVSLIGGLIKAQLANGSYLTQVSLNGGSWQSITGVSSILTAVPNTTLKVRANGNFLQISQSIGLDRLLAALGLGGLFSGLPGTVDTRNTDLTLSITVGPGQSVASGGNGIAAWGLQVGVDVSGTIAVKNLSSLGVLGGTAVINVPSGISGDHYGNVMDLRLAYASCTSGSAPPVTHPIPPALI
jgi:hypothetical protein